MVLEVFIRHNNISIFTNSTRHLLWDRVVSLTSLWSKASLLLLVVNKIAIPIPLSTFSFFLRTMSYILLAVSIYASLELYFLFYPLKKFPKGVARKHSIVYFPDIFFLVKRLNISWWNMKINSHLECQGQKGWRIVLLFWDNFLSFFSLNDFR